LEPPLVVDLDGTLLHSDLLLETWLHFLRDQPQRCLVPLLWLARGKAALKCELALVTTVDIEVLPYDEAVLAFVRSEHARGRRIVLATASHRHLAQQIADHLQVFDEVLATDADRNLSAHSKRDLLTSLYGQKGFDYAGNSQDDLPVWEAARRAYVANASPRLERRARRLNNFAGVLASSKPALGDWIRQLRLHQWLKNLLIFVPLFAAHRYGEPELLAAALVAFVCFGLCASGVYVLNDLLDLRDDRHHPIKRHRPFASGQLPILAGLAAIPILLSSAFALALWLLPAAFTVSLATYFVLTLGYSLGLKRRMVIDVVALATLYTLRVIGGAMALEIPLSFWLLAFSMFMFLSLALVKRYAELFQMRTQGNDQKIRGRGYYADDLSMIASLGAAAGYMAVLVMALYVNDAQTTELYSRPAAIWLACPLLLTWVSRIWMLTHRGEMNEDPVIFAARDRVSLAIALLVALLFWAAL